MNAKTENVVAVVSAVVDEDDIVDVGWKRVDTVEDVVDVVE